MKSPNNRPAVSPDDIVKISKKPVSRRSLLKMGAMSAAAATTLASIDSLTWAPKRVAQAAPTTFPDIQFNIGSFIAPAQTFNGFLFQFGPVNTVFLTAQLTRTPGHSDQSDMANALNTIESFFSFSPSGIFTFVSYGLPFFRRITGGLTGSIVSSHMPRLSSNTSRFVLEEAVPGPTDVSSVNPGITKQTFNVPVAIESNDVCFTFRSDNINIINDVVNWILGSDELDGFLVASPNFAFNGLLNFTTIRTEFVQNGLPRQIANQNNLPFATTINPQSPMWMGFADQQVDGSGPAAICTFLGNSSAKITTANSGDYFDNGSIQHLSHVIQDLAQFYKNPDEPYTERVQYMFRSDPIPSLGNADQFTDGGGTAFLDNSSARFLHFKALGQLENAQTAQDTGTITNGLNPINDPQPPSSPDPNDVGIRRPRIGHEAALQMSSRAADGTPMHIRMDGPGFSAGDVPNGTTQPKLQFTVMVPTAEFFRVMRVNAGSLQFQSTQDANGNATSLGVHPDDNGLERFLTATRRQNFLMPPRRHRAFPLVEFTNVAGVQTAPEGTVGNRTPTTTISKLLHL
jgi:hypothetical protein